MKKKIIISALAAAALVCGCAKVIEPGANDANKRYFEAWLQKHHPNLVDQKQAPGYYVISDVPGTGEIISLPSLTPYFRANYRITDLDGNIIGSTYEQDAYKLRTHSDVAYYGPSIFARENDALYAGLEFGIRDMRVGGTREILIPGWLITNDRYDTEQEYIEHVTGTSAIYKVEILEAISDIAKWERDSVSRFVLANRPSAKSDTTGFYKATIGTPGKPFSRDTTIYINYIGRRLDGTVFDTNIADTAKVHHLWSSGGTYKPAQINWKEKWYDITMTSGETSVISGFALLLNKMGDKEKAVGVFTSEYGYSVSGSGANIPAYCPLQFEVEIVDKEE